MKPLCNEYIKVTFKYLKCMVSSETLLNYPDYKVPLPVHTDTSDKHLGSVIIQNNNTLAFFFNMLIKPQWNYNTTEK